MAQRLSAVRGAVALDPVGGVAELVAEPLEQPRFSDPRLSFDQHEAPRPVMQRLGRRG
jgi:hypothetical protein